jgi:hypothetical protein
MLRIPLSHRAIAGDLPYPVLIEMRRYPRHMHFPLKMGEFVLFDYTG